MIKLPKLSKTYIKNVLHMRKDYATAKHELLKLLETKRDIGAADGNILKKMAENLRLQDKFPDSFATYWLYSTQLRELLSEQSLETFKLMNDPTMHEIFWDIRVPDEQGHCNLPELFY